MDREKSQASNRLLKLNSYYRFIIVCFLLFLFSFFLETTHAIQIKWGDREDCISYERGPLGEIKGIPPSFALDKYGNVYLPDILKKKIKGFNPKGELICSYDLDTIEIADMAASEEKVVHILTRDGTLKTWGRGTSYRVDSEKKDPDSRNQKEIFGNMTSENQFFEIKKLQTEGVCIQLEADYYGNLYVFEIGGPGVLRLVPGQFVQSIPWNMNGFGIDSRLALRGLDSSPSGEMFMIVNWNRTTRTIGRMAPVEGSSVKVEGASLDGQIFISAVDQAGDYLQFFIVDSFGNTIFLGKSTYLPGYRQLRVSPGGTLFTMQFDIDNIPSVPLFIQEMEVPSMRAVAGGTKPAFLVREPIRMDGVLHGVEAIDGCSTRLAILFSVPPQVRVYSTEGNYLTTVFLDGIKAGEPGKFTDLTVLEDRLAVADRESSTLYIFDNSRRPAGKIRIEGLENATSSKMAGNGSVIVANALDGNLKIFSNEGKFLACIEHVTEYVLDENGHLHIMGTSGRGIRVDHHDQNGNFMEIDFEYALKGIEQHPRLVAVNSKGDGVLFLRQGGGAKLLWISEHGRKIEEQKLDFPFGGRAPLYGRWAWSDVRSRAALAWIENEKLTVGIFKKETVERISGSSGDPSEENGDVE